MKKRLLNIDWCVIDGSLNPGTPEEEPRPTKDEKTELKMKTSVIEISQYDTLTKFHRGIDPAEALVIVKMLNDGADICIVNDNEDALLITRWEVIRTDGVGQLAGVSEENYEAFKATGFQFKEE